MTHPGVPDDLQRYVDPAMFAIPGERPATRVTFDAEARLKHAATLWIVLGYLMIAGWALGFLLLLASLSTVT